jgi:branched-chain amino acid aminotransferase
MNTPLAYLNGRFLPFAEAALPLHDAGFVSGATVVDNARTFRHRLFRWPDHLARFRRDCAACYVPLEAADEQLTATAEELVSHNAKLLLPGGELQLVTFATPGPLGFYLGESANGPATLGMVTYPLPFRRYRPFFTEGVTLVAVGQQRRSDAVLPPTVKHRSRMSWHVADHKAREQAGNPHALAVIARDAFSLTETSIANILIIKDGVAISPPREDVLDGISLRVTRELCGSLDIPFAHAPVSLSDLAGAEAVLTGTGFCLAGVKEILNRWQVEPHHFVWPGPVFRKLLAAWSDLVGVDIEGQFTAPTA